MTDAAARWNSARNPRKDAHLKVLHIRDRRNYSAFCSLAPPSVDQRGVKRHQVSVHRHFVSERVSGPISPGEPFR